MRSSILGTKNFFMILVFLGLCPGRVLAEIQIAGSVTQTTVQTEAVAGKKQVLLDLDTGGTVEISVYAPDVVRVRFHWAGLWEKENLAIAKAFAQWPAFPCQFEERAGNIYLETDELIVEIVKSPNVQIHFQDKSGDYYLSKDNRMEFDQNYSPRADTTYKYLRWTGAWPQGFKLKAIREMPANEAYFGFGELAAEMNRRGKSIQGWNADTFSWSEHQNPMYMTMPFFYGVQGEHDGHPEFAYGIFFNNPARPFFRMGNEWADKYSFQAGDGQIDYFFFGGGAQHSMKAVLNRYTELTGRPTMLPKWAFGYHISRWTYDNQGWVNWLVDEHRRRDIPLDAIYVDIDYMDTNADNIYDDNTLHQLTFNQNFPDPAGMIQHSAAQGVKLVPIVEAWLTTGDPKWGEAVRDLHFIKNHDGSTHISNIFFGQVSWLDFSSTPARDWWKGKLHGFLDQYPFAGIWNDLNEPADNDEIPLDGLFWQDGKYDGPEDSRKWFLNEKNQYCLREVSLTYDMLTEHYPNQRPFVLSRAGWPGIQRYALGWSGDNVADFHHLRHNIGLGLSVMISGQANFGHDVGGFVGDSNGELMTRWSEWAALNPLFRNHSMKSFREREPWRFGEPYASLMRNIIRFRYQLMPYLYTLAYQSTQTGMPMNTPTVFHFMKDTETHYQNENDFMIGENLLAAPVIEGGVDHRWVYLPAGTDWYHWHDDQKKSGGAWTQVYAPLGRLPLFVKAGAIVPMGPAMAHTNQFQPDFLDINVWPAGNSEFTLYEDDGESFDYRHGQYRKTKFISQADDDSFSFTIQAPEGSYNAGGRHFIVIVHDTTCPQSVQVNDTQVVYDDQLQNSFSYQCDPDMGILKIKVPDDSEQITICTDQTPSPLPTVNIGWCNLQWPEALTTSASTESGLIYGQVWSAGVTDSPNAPQGISAELGYGPDNSDPRLDPSWTWIPASFNGQRENNAEFQGTVTINQAGHYRSAYRFSGDGGASFLYCDRATGTTDGFALDDLGHLSVIEN